MVNTLRGNMVVCTGVTFSIPNMNNCTLVTEWINVLKPDGSDFLVDRLFLYMMCAHAMNNSCMGVNVVFIPREDKTYEFEFSFMFATSQIAHRVWRTFIPKLDR